MPIPLIALGIMAGASAVGALYQAYATDKQTRASDVAYQYSADYSRAFYGENDRFWADYIRLHHLGDREIKYPYRLGMNPDMTKLFMADAHLTGNEWMRRAGYVNGGASAVRGGAFVGGKLYESY